MAKTSSNFRQSDLQRAVMAARACELPIYRTEIGPDGTIVLVHRVEGELDVSNELDRWMARRAH